MITKIFVKYFSTYIPTSWSPWKLIVLRYIHVENKSSNITRIFIWISYYRPSNFMTNSLNEPWSFLMLNFFFPSHCCVDSIWTILNIYLAFWIHLGLCSWDHFYRYLKLYILIIIWWCGNLWKSENVEKWKSGNVKMWKSGKVEMEMWKTSSSLPFLD